MAKSGDLITISQNREDTDRTRQANITVHLGSESKQYFVQIPRSLGLSLSPYMDGALLMNLLPAMEAGHNIHLQGKVTARTLRNVRELQEAWVNMAPRKYRHIRVTADRIVSNFAATKFIPSRTRAISAFSGGVDASFTAIRHGTSDDPGMYPVTHAACILGLDVPLSLENQYDASMVRAAPILEKAGLEPVFIRSDFRRVMDPRPWSFCFSASIAGILHIVASENFSYALIGSSEPYSHPVVPWGSTPATDHLLSGGRMKIVHDGAGFSRTEKVRLLAQYPEAANNVKVCWQGKMKDRNCGQCEKCIRTRLNFLAVGCENPGCFDTPFDISMVSRLTPINRPQVTELRTILDYADAHGVDAPWVSILRSRAHLMKPIPPKRGRASNVRTRLPTPPGVT